MSDEPDTGDQLVAKYNRWVEENPVQAKLSFLQYDETTMRLPLDEDTYTYVVERLINSFWRMPRWRSDVRTDAHHRQYIDALRSKFVFPDYLELVGPPKPEHYDDNGHLTTQRKATLLLIGVFDWRGLRIARHQAVFGYYRRTRRSWWDDDRPYTDEQKGWYVPVKQIRPGPKVTILNDYFRPLRNFRCERLEEVLTPHEKYTRLMFKDANRYNCHPDNIDIVSTRGRPMTCRFCGSRVTARTSRRFKWDGGTVRACLNCLESMPVSWRKPIV
jgi:hypothetical protein